MMYGNNHEVFIIALLQRPRVAAALRWHVGLDTLLQRCNAWRRCDYLDDVGYQVIDGKDEHHACKNEAAAK